MTTTSCINVCAGDNLNEKFVGEVKSFAITGEEEAVSIEDGEVKSSLNRSSSQEGELAEEVFVGEKQSFSITGEEEAVPESNAMILYAASSTLTYSWGLYPEYALVSGVKADAVSEAKKGGSYCKIDSIYARASIILNDGTKVVKKKTKKSASSVTAHVYDECYTMSVQCFKSGHKFINAGYNTVTKHVTKYVE